MKRIKFILKRIFDMDFKAIFETVSNIHKKSGKSRIVLFIDIIWCGFKYGAGYRDYEYFEFYTLNAEQRATYIVRTTNNLITMHCNKREYYHFLDDKVDFNTRYNDYLKRDWLDFPNSSKEDFMKFIEGKTAIIVKPVDACCGVGVEKLNVQDFESYDAMYEKLKTMPNAHLLEDYVIQHSKMMELYPYSVNTCRITTLLVGDKVNIVYAVLRIGNNAKVVDNLNNGGMFAPINAETGEVYLPACDKQNIKYEVHPMTGVAIRGFKIPCWDEAIKLVTEASFVTPEIRYCGWDVAITENGPLFIEANHLPGYDIQIPPSNQEVKTYGALPFVRELLKDEFKI